MIRSPPDLISSSRFCSMFDDLMVGPPLYTRSTRPSLLRRTVPSKKTEMFQLFVNIKHFKISDVSVKTVDNFVVIHAKHEEKTDEHGFITREFKRRYELPENVDPETVTSAISQDGMLIISAPIKPPKPPASNERIVKIVMQAPASLEETKEYEQKPVLPQKGVDKRES